MQFDATLDNEEVLKALMFTVEEAEAAKNESTFDLQIEWRPGQSVAIPAVTFALFERVTIEQIRMYERWLPEMIDAGQNGDYFLSCRSDHTKLKVGGFLRWKRPGPVAQQNAMIFKRWPCFGAVDWSGPLESQLIQPKRTRPDPQGVTSAFGASNGSLPPTAFGVMPAPAASGIARGQAGQPVDAIERQLLDERFNVEREKLANQHKQDMAAQQLRFEQQLAQQDARMKEQAAKTEALLMAQANKEPPDPTKGLAAFLPGMFEAWMRNNEEARRREDARRRDEREEQRRIDEKEREERRRDYDREEARRLAERQAADRHNEMMMKMVSERAESGQKMLEIQMAAGKEQAANIATLANVMTTQAIKGIEVRKMEQDMIQSGADPDWLLAFREIAPQIGRVLSARELVQSSVPAAPPVTGEVRHAPPAPAGGQRQAAAPNRAPTTPAAGAPLPAAQGAIVTLQGLIMNRRPYADIAKVVFDSITGNEIHFWTDLRAVQGNLDLMLAQRLGAWLHDAENKKFFDGLIEYLMSEGDKNGLMRRGPPPAQNGQSAAAAPAPAAPAAAPASAAPTRRVYRAPRSPAHAAEIAAMKRDTLDGTDPADPLTAAEEAELDAEEEEEERAPRRGHPADQPN